MRVYKKNAKEYRKYPMTKPLSNGCDSSFPTAAYYLPKPANSYRREMPGCDVTCQVINI